MATRSLADFKKMDVSLSQERLTRYWAAYRNQLEVLLIRKVGCKIDQRLLDTCVAEAVNRSFFSFWDKVCKLPKQRAVHGYELLLYTAQGYARGVASAFSIDILWLKPGQFLAADENWIASTTAGPFQQQKMAMARYNNLPMSTSGKKWLSAGAMWAHKAQHGGVWQKKFSSAGL